MVDKLTSKLADKNQIPQIGNQQAVIAAPTGGATQDAEARTAINLIRAALTYHGLTV